MFGSADLCIADRATRDAMHRAEQARQAAETAERARLAAAQKAA
ncbi:hypothetical protein ACFWDI_28225 [Streptomyces sp. NPDC060064]